MQVSAIHKNAKVCAQKARLVADQVRGMAVGKAVDLLAFSPKKAAGLVKKVLESAIANAEHNHGADIDALKVSGIMVDEGVYAKRFAARARGRANRIIKRYCHIKIIVSDTRGE